DPPQKKSPKTKSHRSIQKAHTYFKSLLEGLVSGKSPEQARAELREIVQIIQSDLVLACIPVDSERDAFQIFETLNDRGLRLSVPDLLLNYLMRVAEPEVDREKIRALWNDMLEGMGRRDINKFLRHMWVSKYGDLKNQDLFSA